MTSDQSFANVMTVGHKVLKMFMRSAMRGMTQGLPSSAMEFLQQDFSFSTDKDGEDLLSDAISDFCALCEKPVVVIIDEVDQAGNYEAFIKFLGLLRDKFLNRDSWPTFHSVILAGVYDIRNLKLKMRPEEMHHYNSPWNIATRFDVSMELDEAGIRGMLEDYEADHHTGMDTAKMARLLYDYTGGYPFLVSRLCQIIDEELGQDWTDAGFQEAVKVWLSNRIFETRMYNLFISEAQTSKSGEDKELINEGSFDRPLFIKDGRLDMKKVLERFCVHFGEIYDINDEPFIEKQGRKFFLFFLNPIINGTGNYKGKQPGVREVTVGGRTIVEALV